MTTYEQTTSSWTTTKVLKQVQVYNNSMKDDPMEVDRVEKWKGKGPQGKGKEPKGGKKGKGKAKNGQSAWGKSEEWERPTERRRKRQGDKRMPQLWHSWPPCEGLLEQRQKCQNG